MDDVIIPLNKWKIMFMMIWSLIFVVLSLLVFFLTQTEVLDFDYYHTKTVSLIGVFFFLGIAFYSYRKYFDNRPWLIVNNEWITDNSSSIALWLIKWENINNIGIYESIGCILVLLYLYLQTDCSIILMNFIIC